MYASKVSLDTLHKAAQEVGVSLDVTSLSTTRHRVKVNPGHYTEYVPNAKGRNYRPKYGRISPSGRRVHAVCWHGFRDFFRAVYAVCPEAVFRTGLATWKGREHFEANFRASGEKNIGGIVRPMRFCAACTCPESGDTGPTLLEICKNAAYDLERSNG